MGGDWVFNKIFFLKYLFWVFCFGLHVRFRSVLSALWLALYVSAGLCAFCVGLGRRGSLCWLCVVLARVPPVRLGQNVACFLGRKLHNFTCLSCLWSFEICWTSGCVSFNLLNYWVSVGPLSVGFVLRYVYLRAYFLSGARGRSVDNGIILVLNLSCGTHALGRSKSIY